MSIVSVNFSEASNYEILTVTRANTPTNSSHHDVVVANTVAAITLNVKTQFCRISIRAVAQTAQ